MMKQVVKIGSIVLCLTGIVVFGYWLYEETRYVQPVAGDIIGFDLRINGPIVHSDAYILRGESPHTKVIGKWKLPAEVKKGEIRGSYYDVEQKMLYVTNDTGFFRYHVMTKELKIIKFGYMGHTFKVENGTIYVNQDIGMNRTGGQHGYQSKLCEYGIHDEKLTCRTFDNIQIFDVVKMHEAYYLVGNKSGGRDFVTIIPVVQVYDEKGNLQQSIEVELGEENAWFPKLFHNEAGIISIDNDDWGYYNYNTKEGKLDRFTNLIPHLRLSNATTTTRLYGGRSVDYDEEHNCTYINHTADIHTCRTGIVIVKPLYNGNVATPDSANFLTKEVSIGVGHDEKTVITVIDLTTLTEVQRFDVLDGYTWSRQFIYLR